MMGHLLSDDKLKEEGEMNKDRLSACVIFANLCHYYITRRSVSHWKWMTSSAGPIHVWLERAPLWLPVAWLSVRHASFKLSHNLVLVFYFEGIFKFKTSVWKY